MPIDWIFSELPSKPKKSMHAWTPYCSCLSEVVYAPSLPELSLPAALADLQLPDVLSPDFSFSGAFPFDWRSSGARTVPFRFSETQCLAQCLNHAEGACWVGKRFDLMNPQLNRQMWVICAFVEYPGSRWGLIWEEYSANELRGSISGCASESTCFKMHGIEIHRLLCDVFIPHSSAQIYHVPSLGHT